MTDRDAPDPPPTAPPPAAPSTPTERARVDRVEELLLEMKDTSELMVDLAYSAVFYDSKSIAREVQELEEDVGEHLTELQRLTLEAVRDGQLDIGHALVLLRVAQGAEQIADSALEIADVVLRDVELHPIIRESIRESDTTITKTTLGPACPFVGRSLRESELETETGMRIIAVKRGRKWESGMDGDYVLQAGDQVIATGPWDAEKGFLEMAAPPEA